MTTPTHPTKVCELLRELAGGMLAHPEELQVIFQEANDGACLFGMQGDREDEPRLIGGGGSHVKALEHLVERMGMNRGRKWSFRLVTNTSARERKAVQPRATISHDPKPSLELLGRVVCEVTRSGYKVSVGPGTGPRSELTYHFCITFTDPEGRELMVSTSDEERTFGSTLIGSLGTLFRAIGRNAGVRYELSVQAPVSAKTL